MNSEKHTLRHVLMLQAAVMMFGLSSVIGRYVSVSAVTLAGGRVVFSSLILFLVLKMTGQPVRSRSAADAWLTVLAGLLLAVHWTSFFRSVKTASVAVGTVTYSSFPLFVLVLEPLLYHERMTVRNAAVCLILIAGVLITVPEFTLSNRVTEGILWGMASSLTYALLTLANRKLAGHCGGVWISFREQATAAVLLLPVILAHPEPVSVRDLAGMIVIGTVCTALAYSLFVTAQKSVSALTAGISAGMETVYSILFALLFLGEVPSGREVAGALVILAAMLLSVLPADCFPGKSLSSFS